MARPFRFDGRWSFSATPDELWRVFSDTDRLQELWPWLRSLESPGLMEGTVSRCVVRAPVPYTVSVEIALRQVVPPRLVVADVSGDLAGPARLEVATRPDGSEARLTWELEARAPLLRAASMVARPLMDWGHNWVVDTGVRQFRRKALGEQPPPHPTP
jgi:carbon monoxide dehydrogenase subunit G